MGDEDLRYTFTCPNCKGNFAIQLERIPPVRARFRCPHCKQPMDFPSREEARIYSSLQTSPGAPPPVPSTQTPEPPVPPPPPPPEAEVSAEPSRFQVIKPGFEQDVYDRRAIRNLIRTGELIEGDRVKVDDGESARVDDLPYLKSLFNLRKTSKALPPRVCRTHTDKVAFYICSSTGRPLCEDCSVEKKYGGTSVRICEHCGGTSDKLDQA